MNIPAEIAHIERVARERGVRLNVLLDDAGIDRSTWTRWKQGKTLPRMRSWIAVEASVRRIYGAEARS